MMTCRFAEQVARWRTHSVHSAPSRMSTSMSTTVDNPYRRSRMTSRCGSGRSDRRGLSGPHAVPRESAFPEHIVTERRSPLAHRNVITAIPDGSAYRLPSTAAARRDPDYPPATVRGRVVTDSGDVRTTPRKGLPVRPLDDGARNVPAPCSRRPGRGVARWSGRVSRSSAPSSPGRRCPRDRWSPPGARGPRGS